MTENFSIWLKIQPTDLRNLGHPKQDKSKEIHGEMMAAVYIYIQIYNHMYNIMSYLE